jgi:hypothetical protein
VSGPAEYAGPGHLPSADGDPSRTGRDLIAGR